MDTVEYQERAHATGIYGERIEELVFSRNLDNTRTLLQLSYVISGINGEAGEIADIFKKVMRDDRGMFSQRSAELMRKEVGDTIWYLSELCSVMGWTLAEVMHDNIEKLEDRKERNTLQGSGDER